MAATINDYINKNREGRDYLKRRTDERTQGATQLRNKYGYDDRLKSIESANKQLYDTEKVLSRLPGDVKRRTTGRPVTSSQLNRITANEQQPLVQNVGDQSRNLQVQQTGLDSINRELQNYSDTFDRDTNVNYGAINNEADSLFKAYDADFRERQAREQAAREERARASESSYQNALLQLQRQQLAQAMGSRDGVGDSLFEVGNNTPNRTIQVDDNEARTTAEAARDWGKGLNNRQTYRNNQLLSSNTSDKAKGSAKAAISAIPYVGTGLSNYGGEGVRQTKRFWNWLNK